MLSRDELMRRASSGIHAAFNSPGRGPPVPAAAVVATGANQVGDASAAEIRGQLLTAASGSIPSHRIPRPQPLQSAGDLDLDDLMRTAGTAEQREIERLRRQQPPHRGRDTMDLGIVNIHDSVGRMQGGDSMDDAMLRGKRRGSDSASGTRSNATASGAGSVAATQRSVDYAQGLRVVDSAPAANMQDILRRAPGSPSGAAAGAVVVPGASGFPGAAAALAPKPVVLFTSSGGGRVDSPLQNEPSVGL